LYSLIHILLIDVVQKDLVYVNEESRQGFDSYVVVVSNHTINDKISLMCGM